MSSAPPSASRLLASCPDGEGEGRIPPMRLLVHARLARRPGGRRAGAGAAATGACVAPRVGGGGRAVAAPPGLVGAGMFRGRVYCSGDGGEGGGGGRAPGL